MALEERYLDFDEYIRQGEPDKREKAAIWQTAIGLQAVDGLTTSDYLKETARRHIEGEIGIDEAGQLIDSYYKSKDARLELTGNRTEEADKVSQRITKLLEEQTFVFAPGELVSIHRRLFKGVYDHAGKFRSYNITKQEWVLDGETVLYSGFDLIKATLDYGFCPRESLRLHAGVCRGGRPTYSAICVGYLANPSFRRRKYTNDGGFCHQIFAQIRFFHHE